MTLTGIRGLGEERPAPTRPVLLALLLAPLSPPLAPPPALLPALLLALLPGLAGPPANPAAEVSASVASAPASSSKSLTTKPPRIQASSVRAAVVMVIGTVGILTSTLTV